MKKIFKGFVIFLFIIGALCGGYYVGYTKLVDVNKLFNNNEKMTYEQVVEVLEVVCEDQGFSTSSPSALSSVVYAEDNNLDFGLKESYFQSVPSSVLNKYVEEDTFYTLDDILYNAISIELANGTLKLNEVKKTVAYEGTDHATDLYYYLETIDKEIYIDFASDDYVKHANTGDWIENTCVGYRVCVEYDLENFEDGNYVVRTVTSIPRSDSFYGYSLMYQHVKGGQIKDCGVTDFAIQYDEKNNILKDSVSSINIVNANLVTNKACVLLGSDGSLWWSGSEVLEKYVDEISNDEALQIVTNFMNYVGDISDLPSTMYTTFCTENNPYLQS